MQLSLSEAIAVAHTQGCSLDYLAGRSHDAGQAITTGCRLDGSRIVALRKERKLSESDLRARLDLSLGEYRSLVRGSWEPSLALIAQIADIFDLGLATLVETTPLEQEE